MRAKPVQATQLALDFSGARPLSQVLEQTRVIRAKRDASLHDAEAGHVYGRGRDGQVHEWPITKWTPKRVWFATSQELWRGELLHVGFADREMFERDGRAHLYGTSVPGVFTVYATREAAEIGDW